ncbi:hypothetical protein ACQ4LE_001665 [Meloidogyne hapla]
MINFQIQAQEARSRSIGHIHDFMCTRALGDSLINLATSLLPHINNAIFNARLPGEMEFGLMDLSDRWGDFDTETLEIRLHNKIRSRRRLVGTMMHELSHYAVLKLDRVIEEHGEHWRAWISIVKNVFPELNSEMLSEFSDNDD